MLAISATSAGNIQEYKNPLHSVGVDLLEGVCDKEAKITEKRWIHRINDTFMVKRYRGGGPFL
jgi:hypothetical protein